MMDKIPLPAGPRGSRPARRLVGSATRASDIAVGSSSSSSRPSVKKLSSAREAVIVELPATLWGIISTWLLPCEFLRLLTCRHDMVPDVWRSRLWHFFCHFAGFVRMPLHGSDVHTDHYVESLHDRRSSSCSSGLGLMECPILQVDFETTFKRNAWAKVHGRHFFSWVRVGPEELRLAIPEAEAIAEATGDLWDGSCSVALLRSALRQVLPLSDDSFRLRELVMGREGVLLKNSTFFRGESNARAVVECLTKSASGKTWRLPPTVEQKNGQLEAKTCDAGPLARARTSGWMVELTLCPEEAQADEAQPPCLEALRCDTRWLHVAAEKPESAVTVRDLCKAISAELQLLGGERLHSWPSSTQNSRMPADDVQPGWDLVRDLRWTQSEKLFLREVRVPYRPETDKWKLDTEESTGVAQRSSEASSHAQARLQTHRVVVFERCALRLPLKLRSTKCNKRWTSASASLAASLASLPTQVSSGLARNPGTLGTVIDSVTNCFAYPSTSLSSSICSDSNADSGIAHSRHVLFTTSGVRQFEFHPVRPEILLLGKKSGTAEIVNYETDTQTHCTQVDAHPILGLSWLNQHPQRAVVAASQSGVIKFLRYDELNHGRMESIEMDSFEHLSSLSMNCTDDYFMTSGFCTDVGLYDVFTGRRINTFQTLHHNFINILRFAHRTPHMFATASFDNTCKVWDLREPIVSGHKPAICLNTGTLNVMCCFCPNDSRVLVSGVDDALRQFDLRVAECRGTKFPVPAMNSSINYRRSLYLAGGRVVASVATNETLLRLFDSEAPHRCAGQINFRNMSLQKPEAPATAHTEGKPRLAGRLSNLPFNHSVFLGRRVPARGGSAPPRQQEPSPAGPTVEYLQSLRCHPTDPTLLGAIVAASEPTPESLVTTIRFEDQTGGIVGG
eukprot:TRINITY_DN26154_c0_g1_i1.p1 TRINITY_DN26154_c0_g1~~TRINITY_DN26154_c0_g1_i1.p1  ORF type:complete len:905 (+),score=106.64 TRINITY_DN26154_c0_g1_i1:134-2848(+)